MKSNDRSQWEFITQSNSQSFLIGMTNLSHVSSSFIDRPGAAPHQPTPHLQRKTDPLKRRNEVLSNTRFGISDRLIVPSSRSRLEFRTFIHSWSHVGTGDIFSSQHRETFMAARLRPRSVWAERPAACQSCATPLCLFDCRGNTAPQRG